MERSPDHRSAMSSNAHSTSKGRVLKTSSVALYIYRDEEPPKEPRQQEPLESVNLSLSEDAWGPVDNRFDIIAAMSNMGCQHLLSLIFSHLKPAELTQVACVSKTWRDALLNDTKSNGIRCKYIEERKQLRKSVGKENWLNVKLRQNNPNSDGKPSLRPRSALKTLVRKQKRSDHVARYHYR